MSEYIKKYNFVFLPLFFTTISLFLLFLGNFQTRTILKDSLSILVIVAIFLMIAQFFVSRGNKYTIKVHKVIGYIFVPILLVHPFLIVLPRFFESGIAPKDAFVTMITTLNMGIVLGIVAWFLMLILGLSSMFRSKLGMKYKTWKLLHGILSMAFMGIAIYHAVELGRHMDIKISIIMIFLALFGSSIFVKRYLHVKRDR